MCIKERQYFGFILDRKTSQMAWSETVEKLNIFNVPNFCQYNVNSPFDCDSKESVFSGKREFGVRETSANCSYRFYPQQHGCIKNYMVITQDKNASFLLILLQGMQQIS